MADLFEDWLPALWNKTRPAGAPPIFMMHRFLAADRDFADGARVIQRDVRDPELTFRTWQGYLPRAPRAPAGLSYVAPRKPPEAEALVRRIMEVERLSRSVAEEVLELFTLLGEEEAAFHHYGVEQK